MLLITGAQGFLGRHVSKLAFNNVCPRMDLLNFENTLDIMDEYSPDKVLHLAARVGGIKYNLENPAKLIYENVQMALNLFEAARLTGVKEIITIGSTCQYPLLAPIPFNVRDIWKGYPESSNGAYGIAKRVVMEIGDSYQKQFGINHKHVILANLYGPGADFDLEKSHVVPALIYKVLHDDRVEVWGDGTAKRELLYIDDAAEILAKLIDEPFSGPVNVGSETVVTISELIDRIMVAHGTIKPVVFNAAMPSGQHERTLDSKYKGKTDLDTGLSKMLEWVKSCAYRS